MDEPVIERLVQSVLEIANNLSDSDAMSRTLLFISEPEARIPRFFYRCPRSAN